MKTDGSEATKLNDATTMFACVAQDGFVYYGVKSETAGLWRVSVDGGTPQQVASGFISNYCVADDGYVYYINASETYNVRRVHPDGTGDELFFPFDFPVTTLNVAGGSLYIAFNITYEEDGFVASEEIISHDIATRGKGNHVFADTEPLCLGPDGWLYYTSFNDNMAWYAMDVAGQTHKIGE